MRARCLLFLTIVLFIGYGQAWAVPMIRYPFPAINNIANNPVLTTYLR
jgi:hypothetical protein